MLHIYISVTHVSKWPVILDGSRGAHCAILSQAKIKRCSTPFRSLRLSAPPECKGGPDNQETTLVIIVDLPSGKYDWTGKHPRQLQCRGLGQAISRWWVTVSEVLGCRRMGQIIMPTMIYIQRCSSTDRRRNMYSTWSRHCRVPPSRCDHTHDNISLHP